jgi:hypothetical protein
VVVVVASLVAVAVALAVAVAIAMAVAVASVRVRAVALAMKVAVVPVGREMTATVVVELAVAVVVAVVVEVEVAVAGGVPFGPPNEILFRLGGQLTFSIFYLHTQINTTFYIGITPKSTKISQKKNPSKLDPLSLLLHHLYLHRAQHLN